MNEIVLRTMKQIRSQRTKKPPRPVLREPRSPFGGMALIFIPSRMIWARLLRLTLLSFVTNRLLLTKCFNYDYNIGGKTMNNIKSIQISPTYIVLKAGDWYHSATAQVFSVSSRRTSELLLLSILKTFRR